MPTSSSFSFHTGLGVITAITVLGLIASLLTLIASIFILWRYRRAVARFMLAQSGESALAPEHARAVQSWRSSSSIENCAPDCLLHLMIFEPRRRACRYALAGLLFAMLMGLSGFFAFSQAQINPLRAAAHPLQLLLWVWTFAWPIVLTIHIVAAAGQGQRWLIVLGYFLVLVALGGLVALTLTEAGVQVGNVTLPAWSGESPIRLAAKWSLFNMVPTLLFIIFRHRRLRAVAPLVLSFMTVMSAGVLGIMVTAYIYREAPVKALSQMLGASVLAASSAYFVLIFVVACLLFGALGWSLLVWLRTAYLHKTVSDQSLAIDALWLIFSAYYAAVLAFAGPGWALAALLAFCIFRIAIGAGDKRRRSGIDHGRRAPALLVLRVFSLGKRSALLFDTVAQHWRDIGNVQLIAGTDLALSTVAPHRFLAFVGGKLSSLFIRSAATLDSALAELDAGRDADGRFRINDFFCHADTWQAVLSRLIGSTDVVLMDLRGFAQGNAGCIFEIKALLDAVPLARMVFVVDDTTDKDFLQKTWLESWRDLRSDSPNFASSLASLQPFHLRSAGHREIGKLLRQVCAGAS